MTEEPWNQTDPLTSIWEMPCAAIDLLLAGAFDWRELHNLLSRARASEDATCQAPESPCCVVNRTHNECHGPGLVAHRVQRLLDQRYRSAMDGIRSMATERVIANLRSDFPATGILPVLWALLRDPRTEFDACIESLCRQAQYFAFHNYFGAGSDEFPAAWNLGAGS